MKRASWIVVVGFVAIWSASLLSQQAPTGWPPNAAFSIATASAVNGGGVLSTTCVTWPLLTALCEDAVDTLSQRRGANAQQFYVYNTYTSSTNFERGGIGWIVPGSNYFGVGTAKGSGGGTARPLTLVTDGFGRWTVGATTGYLIAEADNTYDIGASGATRPRTLYMGTSINMAGRGAMSTNANCQWIWKNEAGNAGAAWDFCNNSIWKAYNTTLNGLANIWLNDLVVNGQTAISGTAPTVVAGTGASVTKNNGTAAFTIFTGTTAVASAAITFPVTSNGWAVNCVDASASHGTNLTRQVSTTTTVSVVQNFNTSGVSSAWAANTYLACQAFGM